jgi:hypothetical protein
MEFKIITDSLNDSNIKVFIENMLKFFEQTELERITKLKDKEEKIKLFQNLVDYLESGLKSKYSTNFNVFVNEYPSYVLKYEKRSMLILKHESFDIIIYKTPHTCIPGKFIKGLDEEQQIEIDKFLNEKRDLLANEHIKLIRYYNKLSNDDRLVSLKQWDEKRLFDIVISNIAYFSIVSNGKDTTDLAQSIQFDLFKESKEYEYLLLI